MEQYSLPRRRLFACGVVSRRPMNSVGTSAGVPWGASDDVTSRTVLAAQIDDAVLVIRQERAA